MLATPALRTSSLAFKGWVWLLLCAVLLQGGAGAVVQVLGRAHSHQTPRSAAASVTASASTSAQTWADTFLAWREARLQSLHTSGLFKHHDAGAAAHRHDGLERHHHGPGDTSVAAVDRASNDATADTGQAAGAGAAAPWGPTAEYCVAPAAQAGVGWPVVPGAAWSSVSTRLPERPPRA